MKNQYESNGKIFKKGPTCYHDVTIPIVDALMDMRFGRPAWTQRMLTKFIEEAKKESFKYEGDGTFNHLIKEVWEKGSEIK